MFRASDLLRIARALEFPEASDGQEMANWIQAYTVLGDKIWTTPGRSIAQVFDFLPDVVVDALTQLVLTAKNEGIQWYQIWHRLTGKW